MAESLEQLRKKAATAKAEALKLDQEARDLKVAAREAAVTANELQDELDRAEWARVQVEELGADPELVDVENLTVGTAPPGPTYDETPGG